MEGLWEELAEEGKESFIFKPSDSHFKSDCHFFIASPASQTDSPRPFDICIPRPCA